MSTYVMSDIHGCFDEFMEMLRKIEFSEGDQLILAGDYVDRGPKTFEMLQWILDAPDNVLFLKGNHDLEFARSIEIIEEVIERFDIETEGLQGKEFLKLVEIIRNGLGAPEFDYYGTFTSLFSTYDITLPILREWKDAINFMPYFFKMKVDGEQVIIVHAGFITDESFQKISKKEFPTKEFFYIYAREEGITGNGLSDCTVIAGHTPTIAKGFFFNDGKIFQYRDAGTNTTYYDIDCGIAYRSPKYANARLSCMRLEDRMEFYV